MDRGDQAAGHCSRVDARPQLQLVSGFSVESFDDALHLYREIDGAPDVVEARHTEPATGQIAVVQGTHLLDTEILCRGVELARQLVDDGE